MTIPDSESWLEEVHGFAAGRVRPEAPGWSMGGNPESRIFDEAGRIGLLGIEVPEALGGLGFGFPAKAKALEILASEDFGFAMSLVNTHNIAARLAMSASDDIKALFLPDLLAGRMSACTALTEPGAGSDLAAMTTRAVRDGDEWVLTGSKSWIINARHAGLSLIYAQTDPDAGLKGIGAFLVELGAPGVTRHPIDSPFAQTSAGTGGFSLENVKLSADRMILPPGNAFRDILGEINGARAYVAAMGCGMLDAAIGTAAAYGTKRVVFGKPLAEHEPWREVLDAARTALENVRTLTDNAIEAVDSNGDSRLIAAQAKVAGVEAGQRHLPALLHAMGAEGLKPDHCLARHLAAVQSAALTDGANALLKQQIEKLSTKSKPKGEN